LLQRNDRLSLRYGAEIYLKREDLQQVRSYKIRGAYNFVASLPAERLRQGVVCASAGNHAQGVAWTCRTLGVRGVVFLPRRTPRQKVDRIRVFGAPSSPSASPVTPLMRQPLPLKRRHSVKR